MAGDNVLGAPTEGLGQTVTFAANGAAGIPQAQGTQRGQVRNDLQARGGQANKAQHVQPAKQDATMGLLLKMGETILAPKLEEERTAAYMQGMQQVAEGQVVTDIVADQPWYSKMFGATPLIDGARAYTAFTKAQEVSTAFEAEMPDLRKLSGKEFAAEATRRIMRAKTGDNTTDMMVMGQLTKMLPAKMATQAKQHYLYQQENLVNAQRAAISTAMSHAAVLGAKYRATDHAAVPSDAYLPGAENTDRGELLGAQLAVAEAVQRPEGMDPALHSRNVTEAVSLSLAQGNLDGAYTLLDAGALNSLEPQHQQVLLKAVESAEREKRANLPVELIRDIAALRNAEYTSDPEGIVGAIKMINAKFANLTGTREPLVSTGDTATTLAQWERVDIQRTDALRRAAATAKTAQDKLDAKRAIVVDAAGRILRGSIPADATPSEQQEAWNMIAGQDQAKLFTARASLQAGGMYDKVFQDSMQVNVGNAIRSADPSAMHNIYVQQYLPLLQAGGERGLEVASAYVGTEFAAPMARYHEMRQSRADSEETRVMSLQMAIEKPVKALGDTGRDKEIKAAATTGKFKAVFDRLFAEDYAPMSAAVEQGLARYLAPTINAAPATMDVESAFSYALGLKQANNLTVMGGAFWEVGQGETNLRTWIGKNDSTIPVAPSEVNRATRYAFDKTLEAQGLTDGGQVIQLPDRGGVPTLMVMGMDKEGTPRWAVVTGTTIQQMWAKRNDANRAPGVYNPTLGLSAREIEIERRRNKGDKP